VRTVTMIQKALQGTCSSGREVSESKQTGWGERDTSRFQQRQPRVGQETGGGKRQAGEKLRTKKVLNRDRKYYLCGKTQR